ncbi:MAG: hypothetical protein ACYCW6_15550 [Candidatus Xenobia bacterium]
MRFLNPDPERRGDAMPTTTKVPAYVLELEKYWFLNGFLHMEAILPAVPNTGMLASGQQSPQSDEDSDTEAERVLFDGQHVENGSQQMGWRELAVLSFQKDADLHAHVEEMLHQMEQHEHEFIDPLHRPWRPREFLKSIENFIKMRCRAAMNHCTHCGQANPSEYKQCLKCRATLEKDTLESALEGSIDKAMTLEGFRILPSPCIKFFLLCEKPADGDDWLMDLRMTLRPLYYLFTRSRFLAGEMVRETTDHHVQAAADLINLGRHLNFSLQRGKQLVEDVRDMLDQKDAADIKAAWSRLADAALESQQALCLMIDAWEEFEGVRLDAWWDDAEDAKTVAQAHETQ